MNESNEAVADGVCLLHPILATFVAHSLAHCRLPASASGSSGSSSSSSSRLARDDSTSCTIAAANVVAANRSASYLRRASADYRDLSNQFLLIDTLARSQSIVFSGSLSNAHSNRRTRRRDKQQRRPFFHPIGLRRRHSHSCNRSRARLLLAIGRTQTNATTKH